MLEIVFVIGIVIIGLLGVLGLVMSSIAGSAASQTELLAANLAREGVEAVRQIRDTNWLAGRVWDYGLADDDYYGAIAVFTPARIYASPATNPWQLAFNPSPAATLMYLDDDAGDYYVYYKQDINPLASPFKPTIYSRVIILNEICSDREADYQTEQVQSDGARCAGNVVYPDKIGLKAEIRVSWLERGRRREIVAEDWLYNWR